MYMKLIAALVLLAFCWQRSASTRLYPGFGDAYGYLYAAQTLRDGRGLLNYDFDEPFAQSVAGPPNAPFTSWPPLYPATLALFGADLNAARLVNAIGLWATLILLWVLYADYGVPVSVRIGTSVAFLAMLVGDGQSLLSALSESLFYPLVLALLIALARVKDRRWLMAATVIAVALPLTRYVGLGLVMAGLIPVYRAHRWRGAVLYSLPPLMGISLWLARNLILTGQFTGNTQPGQYTIRDVFAILEISNQWMMSILALSLPLVCLSLIFWWWQRRTLRRSSREA